MWRASSPRASRCDRRIRIVLDGRLRHDVTRIHLSQPAGGAVASTISQCRHYRRHRGQGGEDAPEMMKRLQAAVLDMKPDLVIWQVGTNAVLRNLDPAETAKLVEEGIARIQAAGADLVLVDPQYSPRINERAESASQMVKLLGRVRRAPPCRLFSALRGDARMAREAGDPDRQFRHRRRPAHDRLGLRLLRPVAGRPTSSNRSARSSSASTCRPTCRLTGRCDLSEWGVANSE